MLLVAGSQVQVNLLTYRPKSFAQIIMSLMKNETSHFESSTGHEVVCFWVCRVATTKTCHEIWLCPSTRWHFPTNNSLLSCLSYIMTFFLHLPNKVITQTWQTRLPDIKLVRNQKIISWSAKFWSWSLNWIITGSSISIRVWPVEKEPEGHQLWPQRDISSGTGTR